MAALGSSPRERGTLVAAPDAHRRHRFIPARAGNAPGPRRSPGIATVHPRASGERTAGPGGGEMRSGSSPRERGTPVYAARDPRHRRFIPARAGNAAWRRPGSIRRAVHPRASGERRSDLFMECRAAGSSPRERGTRALHPHQKGDLRFIPARAGNARASPYMRSGRAVHPRASGERHFAQRFEPPLDGSSPRERGTPGHDAGSLPDDRFIPARAGNAACP